jgi:hypothetical protein
MPAADPRTAAAPYHPETCMTKERSTTRETRKKPARTFAEKRAHRRAKKSPKLPVLH